MTVVLTNDVPGFTRKQSEQTLLLQADRYATLLTNSPDGFSIMSANGELREVNKAYCEMSGYSREELLRMKVFELEEKKTAKKIARYIKKVKQTGFERFEIGHKKKDGTIMAAEVSASYRPGADEILAFFRDITERKRVEEQRRQYEEELKKARKMAEYENEAKTRFLATASHDLRQPIQAMHLLAHILVNSELAPETIDIAVRMQEAVDGLGEMLNALLDISKLDAGLINPELSYFRLGELFRQLTDEYLPAARESGIALRCLDSNIFVHSDHNLLTRILRNLISNAIKYTPTGTVLIGARRCGSHARIQVLDTGVGIKAEELERVFEEFHQVGNIARDRREGLGLGLAIVKRLASLLEHIVEVSSVVGRGTCFSIKVPVTAESRCGLQPMSDSQLLLEIPYEGAEILVVDDEVDIREGLKVSLLQWGYTVNVAENFEQAIAAVKEESPPVLVIADYRLGTKTGIDVIRTVRRQTKRKIGALLLTGDAMEKTSREATRLGVQLLRKPISAEQLHRAVVETLKMT